MKFPSDPNDENPLVNPSINLADQEFTNTSSSIHKIKHQKSETSSTSTASTTTTTIQETYHFPKRVKPVPVLSYLSDTQISAVSGALSGFLAGVSVCPLDVAKTRLQAQGVMRMDSNNNSPTSLKYRGIFGTLGKIFAEEGVRGLYRGLVPITIGYLPNWMIYFTVYEKAKVFYPTLVKSTLGYDLENGDNKHSMLKYFCYSISAITAGGVATTITNPIWVVKTRLMLQTSNGQNVYQGGAAQNYYSGTLDACRKMYKSEGIKVFYSGLVPSLFGLFHVAIHFPVYEYIKKLLHCENQSGYLQNNKYRILNNNDREAKEERFYFFLKLILASSLSKMCASTLTYPHEVLRTRLQIGDAPSSSSSTVNNPSTSRHKSRIVRLSAEIYKTQGIKGFYSGYCTNLTRTVPSSAVTLVSFEFIKLYLEKINCAGQFD
ncbi:NAD+ transporter [Saccharomycopsis crataegensis]|uniref:NAD+ transporter n=1 Tax=Saccharomycopsis crataegensis TaxID=43959 RepID=A0AAV5QMV3_9ASCO|nr:NAD+ transporter [Saccharomycopsis crataegensis]